MKNTNGSHPRPYGHGLLFGTFITPVTQPATHADELAAVADHARLDLVTFQDHPYQRSFTVHGHCCPLPRRA